MADIPTIEEPEYENEKFENEFEFLRKSVNEFNNEYLKEQVENIVNPFYRDDYGDNFVMNNQSVLDFKNFYLNYEKEFKAIDFGFFITDDGNLYLQKTTDNLYIFIMFKGNGVIIYNVKYNKDDRVKDNATIEDFWNDMNEKNIMKEFEKNS